MRCRGILSATLSLLLILALLSPHVAWAFGPDRAPPDPELLIDTAGYAEEPSKLSVLPALADESPAQSSGTGSGLDVSHWVEPRPLQSPASVALGRVLFAPAVDADGDPATNPTAGNPVPVIDVAGELMGVVSLAAQLAPDAKDQVVIGVPLTFMVENTDGSELSRTVRSDAWGAATTLDSARSSPRPIGTRTSRPSDRTVGLPPPRKWAVVPRCRSVLNTCAARRWTASCRAALDRKSASLCPGFR